MLDNEDGGQDLVKAKVAPLVARQLEANHEIRPKMRSGDDHLQFSIGGMDDDGVIEGGNDLYSEHHLRVPLEINSRNMAVAKRRSISPSFSRPHRHPSGSALFGIGRKQFKILLVFIVGAIFVASALLVMVRKTFQSSNTDSLEAHDVSEEDPHDTNEGGNGDGIQGTDPSSETATGTINTREDYEPNPPRLPNSMKLIFPPKDQEEAQELQKFLRDEFSDPILTWEEFSKTPKPEGFPDYTHTTARHFSQQRTALLFAPGRYPIDLEVGYYTSVIGLGAHPNDVRFADCDKGPHVPALDKFSNRPPNGSGLDTFWRSAENIATEAREGMTWTVSQAAPLRRMQVKTDLNLFDGGSWVSGGVAANVEVHGGVNFGGQQQWLMRNVELGGGASNGAWSLVFVGCTGNVPKESEGMKGGPSISVENDPNLRVEKPYIVMKRSGRRMRELEYDRYTIPHELADQYEFELRVPAPTFGKNASGTQFEDGPEDSIRNFRHVKLGVPSDSIDSTEAAIQNYHNLQKALDEGKDLVLSPGIYPLSHGLNVKHSDQVVLGLGYATLVAPDDGSPCIVVQSRVPGVRIAGIMLEASKQKDGTKQKTASSLLQWGTPAADDAGDATNPGVLSDVYARVGGVNRDVSTDAMVRIHSGNVYGDNLWLWRADHVRLGPKEEANFPNISLKYRQTRQGECEVKNGIVVDAGAPNVTIVGLAVEHTTEDQTVWNGENGRVYFYQSEFPYDVDRSFGDNKFVGYRIGPNVKHHEAAGLGIYSNFRDHDVEVETAVVHPTSNGGGVRMKNVFTVKLDNRGKISSVVNGRGPGPTAKSERGRPHRCADETCSESDEKSTL